MQKKYFFYHLCCLFFLSTTSWGFSYDIAIPKNKKERYAKINEYLEIAKSTQQSAPQQSRDAAYNAQRLSLNFDENKLVAANLYIAYAYQRKGMLDTAFILITDVLQQAKVLRNDTIQAAAYHALGVQYQYNGSLELSMENYVKALELNDALDLDREKLKQLNNIGMLYREEKEYDLALSYLQKSIVISKEKGYKKLELTGYVNIGYTLMKQNKWKEALMYLEKVLDLTDPLEDPMFTYVANYLLSDIKLQQKEYSVAKKYAKEALAIGKNYDYPVGKIYSLRVLSDVYRQEKRYDLARKTAYEAIQYIKEKAVYLYYEEVLNSLYHIEYEMDNYIEAIAILHKIQHRKDSLNQIEIKEKIANSEFKHQLFKNEQENQLLRIKNENSENRTLFAIALAALLSLLVLFGYVAYRGSKNYNTTLEKAIKQRTKELENSNKYLAKSNEELERFAFVASHDLKTPLLNIISFSNLLSKELQASENEKIQTYLSFILEGGTRMNNLIQDILEFSKLSHVEKKEKKEAVDLNVVFADLSRLLSTTLKKRNAVVKILHPLPIIQAIPHAILTLFQNLLENGIKYNQSEQPTIEIYAEEKQEGLSIFLKDNGIGIPKEFQQKIFTMFTRLHTHAEYEGSGLGLAICKKIVEHHKGTVLIQSVVNEGTIFEITFPK